MNILLKPLQDIPQFSGVIKSIVTGEGPVGVTGLVDSARPLFVYALSKKIGKRCIILTHSRVKAKKMYEAMRIFDQDGALYFPSRELMPFEIEARSHRYETERVNALYRFATNDYSVAIAPIEAMCIRVRKKNSFLTNVIKIEINEEYNRDKLTTSLVSSGYEKCDMVESEGQFSVRGDIMDIFSPGCTRPYRINYFGDQVEKIKYFDSDTQLSDEETETVLVLPYSEQTGSAKTILQELKNMKNLSGAIVSEIEKIENGLIHYPMDKHFALGDETAFPISYINEDTIIILDNDKRCIRKMQTVQKEYSATCEKLLESQRAVPESCKMIAGLFEAMGKRQPELIIADVTGPGDDYTLYRQFSILTRENHSYGGQMDMLQKDIRKWKRKGRRIVLIAPTKKSGGILADYLTANEIDIQDYNNYDGDIRAGTVAMLDSGPAEGFEILEAGLCVVGSGRIFRKSRKSRAVIKKQKGMDLFTDLKPGDFVVHDYHGIGRYIGIDNIKAAGVRRDYVKVEYKKGDYVYIPVDKLDSIQKYIGSGGRAPRLSKLGGREWESTKARAKESVKNIAKELVELYAKRKANKGYRYQPDTVWQVSFEEEFPFEETNDQLKCIDEIKADMESDIIMDRLLCGDVGYGKTEVALRAAFKAVMDGRQVAFLVPTTVLAYQHYNTFLKRMKNFPVNIELMCRFRSKKQLKRTAEKLRAGTVDIVVGTHRLLQKDIVFKKLGLLVVDEEQRFGVEHKEIIKNYKNDIDVLTLTATPIPRTLHMSLAGIRDISIIEDPPAKRFPVQTYVMEYDPDIIRDAVDREVSRGGQAFYLFNRVKEMDSKYVKLTQLFGEDVRIGIAHGQMDENKLENVMVDFINGSYDVLLCTTIIESGLDIPNVNTMIIEDADRMGLSQLYQIRGRVGRSDKVAYAYITHKHGKVITEEASKRLEAIREFTEFGSGFKIAMRDLEIRGAGNLLGANQHGHMGKVGYDLYIRLLNRAVKELGGEISDAEPIKSCTMELNINAFINKEYISNDLMRMDMYKRIAIVESNKGKKILIEELEDRFGSVPDETLTLIDIAFVKNIASACGISVVQRKDRDIILTFNEGLFPPPKKLGIISHSLPRRITVSMSGKPNIAIKCSSKDKMDFQALMKVMEVIKNK